VGASAGGLEAFTAFLKHLPADSGMAFVLIPHLDPRQPSQLADLLSKVTRMPVVEVNADTPLRPDHAYVMGSGVRLSMSDGQLRAEEREAGWNLPIDYFLRSLAQTRSSKAIGVVLSGTASDGTMGLKAVKAEGGITFAQEPSSAKFDGMPRSAIAAGVVDFVLPAEEIAKRLAPLMRHSYVTLQPGKDEEHAQETELELNRIFKVLRTVTGNDFTHYKHTTIRRRIQRRMALRASETLSEYAAYLQENPAEVRALADDLLICVTAFFRDEETLQVLDARIFPEMVKDKNSENPIRIWAPGCATGEEAYSIAIHLTEFLERSGMNVPMRIFATDMSETALEKARAGIYSMSALDGVSPARLKRFFVRAKDGYQISKPIRATCVFATQNVIKDPPFYNLDLISCCNVLIYFGPVLQKKALSTFHYALKPGGILMLGPSESVSPLSQAFLPLGKKLKLYVNQPRVSLLNAQSLAAGPLRGKEASTASVGGGGREAPNIQKIGERVLLTQYAPAAVIVNDALNIVHVRGETGPYLQLASGEPTYSLLKMAREGLVVGLRTALLRAKQRKASVSEQARVKHNDRFKDVNIRVTPINDPSTTTALHFLVVFEDVALRVAPSQGNGKERQPRSESVKPEKTSSARGERENARLRQELAATKDYLQSVIEAQEANAEELKSANEEAQASNEELETSKEELQSTNEELNTLNDELKTRNATLSELNYDLTNVLSGINVPLVMVGKDLAIRRFTTSMEPMLNLIESDVGRSIADLKPNIDVPDLPELLRSVIHGEPRAREIQGPKGAWFSLQALPYKVGDRIEGALLVLLDIDAVKRGRDFAEAIIETVRQPLAILDKNLKVRLVNKAFYQTFHVRKKETEGRFIGDLGNGQWNIPKLLAAMDKILPEKGGFEGFEIEHHFENIGRKTMVLNAREIRQETPFRGPTILLAIEDITARKHYEKNLTGRVEQATEAMTITQAELRVLSGRLIAAQEEERGRIARELHDDLAQRTAVIDLELERLVPLLLPSAKGALSPVREYLAELSAELRKVSHQLHPSVIADLGLPAAVKQLVQEFNDAGGDARFVGRGETLPGLSAEQATNLYRIAQEALHNARKHAPGSRVRVVFVTTDQQVRLSIEDTGPGFNPDEIRNGPGLGLSNMEARAKIVGANLRVRTKPGGGTRITVQIRTPHR
jgi:two-component system CheB/CheR fusion protein